MIPRADRAASPMSAGVLSIPVGLILLAGFILLASILAGRAGVVAAAIAVTFFVILTYYQPLPAILLAIVLSTDGLKFLALSFLPSLYFGPGARFTALDLDLLLLMAVGILHLFRRREQPLFLRPVLLLGLLAAISFGLGLVAGTTSLAQGLNGLRSLSSYLFYVGLVGVIDTRRKFDAVVYAVFALALVSVGVQFVEAGLGQRIVTPTSWTSDYFTGTSIITVGDVVVPYLWNRATGFLFVAFFLALGPAIWSRRLLHTSIAAITFIGFVLAMMRQWYVMIALGAVAIVLIRREGRLKAVTWMLVATLAVAGSIVILASSQVSSSIPLLSLWLARINTIFNFQQEPHFIQRVVAWQAQLEVFLEHPLFGFGPGGIGDRFIRDVLVLADTGLPNTLMQFGLIGFSAIVLLIASYFRHAYRLYRALPVSVAQGYAAGLFGIWIAIMSGYFGFNFFTATDQTFTLTLVVGLLMALLDRLDALSRGALGRRA